MTKLMKTLVAGVAGLALLCGLVNLMSLTAMSASTMPAADVAATAPAKSPAETPAAGAFDPDVAVGATCSVAKNLRSPLQQAYLRTEWQRRVNQQQQQFRKKHGFGGVV